MYFFLHLSNESARFWSIKGARNRIKGWTALDKMVIISYVNRRLASIMTFRDGVILSSPFQT